MNFMDKTVIQLVTYLRVQNGNLFFPIFLLRGVTLTATTRSTPRVVGVYTDLGLTRGWIL